MKIGFVNERTASLLAIQRLPARLTNEQAAELLGFSETTTLPGLDPSWPA